MRERLTTVLGMVVSLGLVLGMGYVLYLAAAATLTALRGMESDIAVAIIAAAATIAVSIVSVVMAKQADTRAAVLQELRAKKIPIYEGIINAYFRVLYADKLGMPRLPEEELARFFVETSEKLTIWGSDDVVKAYRAMRLAGVNDSAAADAIFLFERLMVTIRRDLGHKNRGFSDGTLLGLFVNDIDSFVRQRRLPKR